jgi:hypothetical protein
VEDVPDGGSLLFGAAELPPQQARTRVIEAIANATSNVVVRFSFFIIVTPVRLRLIAVTDWDKHKLFPDADSHGGRQCQTSTRSMPPLLARATYSAIQFSPRMCRAISTTM